MEDLVFFVSGSSGGDYLHTKNGRLLQFVGSLLLATIRPTLWIEKRATNILNSIANEATASALGRREGLKRATNRTAEEELLATAKRKEKKNMVKEERRKAKEDREKEDEEKRMERKKIAKKEVKKEMDDRDIHVDPRFNALFTDSAFSIDTASNLNKSKGLADKQNAVRRKRKAEVESNSPTEEGHNALIAKLKSKFSKWSS